MGKDGRSSVFLDREYIDKKFSDLKIDIISYLDAKFRSMQNGQSALKEMLTETVVDNTPCVESVVKLEDAYKWKLVIRRRVDKMVKENPELYPDFNSVLRKVYRKMRDVYGFVSEQAIKEYKAENGVERASCLEVISENAEYRSLFEPILSNYEEEIKVVREKKRAEAEALAGKSQKEIIAPLIQARQDGSNCGCATYSAVRHRMKRNGVDFAKYENEFRNRTGIKRKIKANELIENMPELKKHFAITVSELMTEVSKSNDGKGH